MKVKSEKEVAQSCPTLSDPMDCSLPGFSIYGIFQARVLEWGAIAFSGCISTVEQLVVESVWREYTYFFPFKEILNNNQIREVLMIEYDEPVPSHLKTSHFGVGPGPAFAPRGPLGKRGAMNAISGSGEEIYSNGP